MTLSAGAALAAVSTCSVAMAVPITTGTGDPYNAANRPRLLSVALVETPDALPVGAPVLIYRTSHYLARGPHGTVKDGATRLTPDPALGSLAQVRRGAHHHACYFTFGNVDEAVGSKHKLAITIGGVTYHRTLTVRRSSVPANKGGGLYC